MSTLLPIGTEIKVITDHWFGQKDWTGVITKHYGDPDKGDLFVYWCEMDSPNTGPKLYYIDHVEPLNKLYTLEQELDSEEDLL